jgi:hypothetical protein
MIVASAAAVVLVGFVWWLWLGMVIVSHATCLSSYTAQRWRARLCAGTRSCVLLQARVGGGVLYHAYSIMMI